MQKIIHTRKTIIMLGILLGSILIMNGNVAFADDAPNTEDPSVTTKIPYVPGTTEYTLDNDMTFRVEVADIPALEITLPSSIVTLDLVPDASTADFNSVDMNVIVGTTNSTGYTLTMATRYNGVATTSLTRTEPINNATPTIETLDTAVSPTLFSSTNDTTTMNKWGYKVNSTSISTIDTTIYHPASMSPITINSSNTAIYDDPTSITFGAKVNSEQVYGEYQTTIKFIAVSNPPIYTYNIKFNGNGGTVTTAPITGSDDAGTNITLPNTGTYHNAYTTNTSTRYATFAGWSEEPNATTPTYTNSFTLNDDTDTTLYAVWNFSSGTLQNPDSTCGSDMIDARTGISYLTATISGDCYMEQNLYLPMGQTLYAGDSNIYSDVAEKNKLLFYTTTTIDLTTGDNSLDVGEMHIGDYADNTFDASGAWYNYCAASAGTACNVQEGANSDVCPRGWKLPSPAQWVNVANANRENWKFYIGYYRDGNLIFTTGTYATTAWYSNAQTGIKTAFKLFYYENILRTNQYSLGDGFGWNIRCVRK